MSLFYCEEASYIEGFTITHNRYVGMKESDITRDQFLPGQNQEGYDKTGVRNAKQLIDIYNNLRNEPVNVLVEYGCGDARVLKAMEQYCDKAVGLDICDLVLAAASENTKAELINVKDFDRCDYADFVYSLQVLQHNVYEDQVKILNHIQRILKPTGLACVHFPKIEDKPWYKNHTTCMCYTKEQVEEFGKMFKDPNIIEIEICTNWFDYYLLGGKLI